MRGQDPRARTGNGWDARSDRTIARKKVVLEGLEAGMRVKDAVALSGVSMGSYQKWRQTDPQFRAECAVARSVGMGNLSEHPGRHYSFAEFRKHYFGMDTYVHQAQIVDALEHVKPREIVLINIHPESGKTTTIEDWICQQLGIEPNLRITDVSESSGLCKKSVARIKARMTDTRNFGKFIAAFGPFYNDGQEREGKPWAKEYFTVAKSDHDERDYSLEARAITSAAYGTRIDVLIVDDIQSRKNLSQTDTIFEHLRQTYFTRGRAMRTVIIGTRIDNGDVYEKMIDAGIIDRYITIPAVQPDGTVTCPELWGVDRSDFTSDEVCDEEAFIIAVKERVAKVRNTVGERVWWASYMQMPEIAGLATFTPEMIDSCKDPARRVARAELTDFVAMSLDPALGGGNVITACAHDIDKLRILDQRVDYGFARTEDILLGLEDFAQRYAPVVCIIERDAFQKGLVNDDRLAQIARQYGFTIVPHTTSKAKADPILGVASMAGDFIRGDVSIPWADEEFTKQRMEPLIAQLRAWRPDVSGRLLKQDAVMSLWFNWRYWKENLLARAQPADAWNRGGTPYAPTPYATVSGN